MGASCSCSVADKEGKIMTPKSADASEVLSPGFRASKRANSGHSPTNSRSINGGRGKRNGEPGSPKSFKKKNNQAPAPTSPKGNLLAQSLLLDFRMALRDRFISSQHAFDRLDNDTSAQISETEFYEFLRGMGYTTQKLNHELFLLCDVDRDGYISKSEFRVVFTGMNHEFFDIREQIRSLWSSYEKAFNNLGGSDDLSIDVEELIQFLAKHCQITDQDRVRRLFCVIDDDQDGKISQHEFKAFFQPQGETAKIVMFKDAIKKHFATAKDAFDWLGGKDDGKIDVDEFRQYVTEVLGFQDTKLATHLFNIIDNDGGGYITKAEFKSLFAFQTAKVGDFREMLKKKFKTRKKAFDELGGSDDQLVSKEEFKELCEKLGMTDASEIEQLFAVIDENNDGTITKAEFKGFFLDK